MPTKKLFLRFKKARDHARSLKLSNRDEWRLYSQKKLSTSKGAKPDNIPANPDQIYSENTKDRYGWISWADWLDTDNIATKLREYKSFEEAKRFCINHNIKRKEQYMQMSRNNLLPKDMPANAARIYRDLGWKGWGDFLGTYNKANWQKKFLPFKKARAYIRKLKIKGEAEWRKYCRDELVHLPSKPHFIPSAPAHEYKNRGWIDWYDWLGKKKKRK